MRALEQLGQDLRFGARNLARAPGVAGFAVASLALGIMATTAMYSVVHAVVLDPFPYKDVDDLTSVRVFEPGKRGGRVFYSIDQFLEIAERSTIFEGVVASTISDVFWTGDAEPQRLRGNHGSANTFQVMGVPALLGRIWTPDDVRPEATPVVVLGYRCWQREFGGDPRVLGRVLRLNGTPRTVVGVMPRRFMWRGADVYVPLAFERGKAIEGVRTVHLVGRLRRGVTPQQAAADLGPIVADLKQREPGQFPERWSVDLLSFKETFPSSIRETLWILFGACGLLLLIACVNVSNLLLSRAATRQQEIATRAALGAGRGRLLRQLLTEGVLLALAGGLLGLPLAYFGLDALIALVPAGTIPDESHIQINRAVLAFTLGVSFLTAVVFGMAPAWHSSKTDLVESLKAGGRSASGGRAQAALRSSLVVAEVALSVMLLVGASLMFRTLLALQQVDLGIRGDRLLTMRLPLPEARYPDAARRGAFLRQLLERLKGEPSVAVAALNSTVHPFGGWNMPAEVPGAAAADTRPVVIHQVSGDYTRALGIPLLQGRGFGEAELGSGLRVALVNQAFVRRYFDGREPLGQVVRLPRTKLPPFQQSDDAFQIVGVVRDTLNRSLTNEVQPELYMPYSLTGLSDRLVLQTRADNSTVAAAVRAHVRALDPDQPLMEVRSLASALDEFVFSGPRFSLVLFAVFAGLGLTLAVIGVFGVISHGVSQRTREIGVRLAVGASAGTIARMIVGGGLRLVAMGVALGLIGSAAAARLLQQLVWKVSPFDPLSFAAVAVVLLFVGWSASLLPALRAARLDPVRALRHD
jgi:putative ABC transport system permease protein